MSCICNRNSNKKTCLKVTVDWLTEPQKPSSYITVEAKPLGSEVYSDAVFLNKDLAVYIETNKDVEVQAELVNRIKVEYGILCCSSQGNYEFLHVAEGQVLTINGEKVLVRKRPLNN